MTPCHTGSDTTITDSDRDITGVPSECNTTVIDSSMSTRSVLLNGPQVDSYSDHNVSGGSKQSRVDYFTLRDIFGVELELELVHLFSCGATVRSTCPGSIQLVLYRNTLLHDGCDVLFVSIDEERQECPLSAQSAAFTEPSKVEHRGWSL